MKAIKKNLIPLTGILLGLLSLSTQAATAQNGAPATNFVCNSYNGNLINAYAGNAAPGLGGFFMSIPSNCTSSNVCVFKLYRQLSIANGRTTFGTKQ